MDTRTEARSEAKGEATTAAKGDLKCPFTDLVRCLLQRDIVNDAHLERAFPISVRKCCEALDA